MIESRDSIGLGFTYTCVHRQWRVAVAPPPSAGVAQHSVATIFGSIIADCSVIVAMAAVAELCKFSDLPDDIGPEYLTHVPSIRNRKRAYAFCRESSFRDFVLEKTGENKYAITCHCDRSQKKTQDPHSVYLYLCGDEKKKDIRAAAHTFLF